MVLTDKQALRFYFSANRSKMPGCGVCELRKAENAASAGSFGTSSCSYLIRILSMRA